MGFNLNDYETVKSRKERFYKDHEDGRIIVELVNSTDPLDYALFKSMVFLNKEDQANNLPRGIGYALEIRDKELSKSKSGSSYESVNYTSWTENAEESAIGRSLDNAGYSGNKKPSREEMEKVGRMKETLSKPNANAENDVAARAAQKGCPKCGAAMVLSAKSGTFYCSKLCWKN